MQCCSCFKCCLLACKYWIFKSTKTKKHLTSRSSLNLPVSSKMFGLGGVGCGSLYKQNCCANKTFFVKLWTFVGCCSASEVFTLYLWHLYLPKSHFSILNPFVDISSLRLLFWKHRSPFFSGHSQLCCRWWSAFINCHRRAHVQ